MSLRRQMLLAIANNYKWLPYSFEYLYHDLIPQKVNKNASLPSAYQEVEYIESSGTQYIDTGYADYGTFVLDCRFKTTPDRTLMGYSTIGTQYFGKDGNDYLELGAGVSMNILATQRSLITFAKIDNSGTLSCRGESIVRTDSQPISQSFKLFGGVDAYVGTGAVIYSCKVFNASNVLVRNFIPCYRKSDNVIGLYDSVNNQFYTNAGSGTFAKGNDVYRIVKDKTRLFKIEGNSEVSNQLVEGETTDSDNGITITKQDDKTYIFSGTSTATAYLDIEKNFQNKLIATHKYLFSIESNNDVVQMCDNYGGNDFSSSKVSVIYEYPSSHGTRFDLGFRVASGKDTTGFKARVLVSDLTQRYPFDTPTSLTDKRVQNIINRGSEDFNSGEIKNTSLGGFISEGFNICDEIFEGGVLGNIGQTESDSNSFRTKNYQEVLPNQTINLHASATMFGTLIVCEYDKDKNFVLRSLKYESDQTLTTQQNTKYIKIAFYKSGSSWQTNVPTKEQAQLCINRSSSLDGTYKPYKEPFDLSFAYQGSGVGTSHDSVEKTATEWVFTKYMVDLDLGSIVWSYTSNYGFYTWSLNSIAKLAPSNSTKADILCGKYLVDTFINVYNGTTNKRIALGDSGSGALIVSDSDYNDATTFKTAMAGVLLEYQLATPQVIRIPLKHLKVVDLGSLNWSYNGTRFLSTDLTDMKRYGDNDVFNLFCSKYITNSLNAYSNNQIAGGSGGAVAIKDSSYTDATTFKNAMKGQYLFYETQDEVADFDLTMGSEAGGTLNSYDFKWIKNQLVVNGNFADNSNWGYANSTLSISNGKATITPTTAWGGIYQTTNGAIANHKYFLYAYITKTNANTSVVLQIGGNSNTAVQESSTNRQLVYYFENNINIESTNYIRVRDRSNVLAPFDVEDVNCIDLTQAKLDDATSINDPRIQRIIKLGYIPTDINGTLTYEETEVLPNVDVKEKAK